MVGRVYAIVVENENNAAKLFFIFFEAFFPANRKTPIPAFRP